MRSTASSPIRPRDPLKRFEHDAGTQCVDLRLVVGRQSTREILFAVGGRWHRGEGRYIEEPAQQCRMLWLNEAQVLGEPGNRLEEGPAWSLKTWLEARRAGNDRLAELVFDGARGSGKSVLGTLGVFLIAVEFPDSRCALVPPANTRRTELEIIVNDFIPNSWRAWSLRDLTYTLPNGSTISYIGADDENALKQGGFEVVLLNEAQLMSSQAYVNATACPRNVSGRPMGLLMLAMNYASKLRGEWTNDHLDKIDSGLPGARRHRLDPKLNEFVEKGTIGILEGLARSARPDLADLDYAGIRKRLGDMAAPAFKPFPIEKDGHVGVPPTAVIGLDGIKRAGWTDVTRELTAALTRTDRGYPLVAGCDFQRRPGCVVVFFRLYRTETGKIVYHAERTIVAGDNEDDLADRMDSYARSQGLGISDVLAICDSSGRWQNSRHDHSDKPSHAILKEWGFNVVAPRKVLKSGKLGKANPDVEDNLALLYDVCQQDRVLVTPDDWLVECLRRCKLKKGSGRMVLDDSRPGYSHAVDCTRYVVWYFEPRRGPAAPPIDREAADEIRKVRVFTSS